MSDQEFATITSDQYCSSYYDNKGRYNDGFPCPSNQVCCHRTDGNRQCCLASKIQSNINTINQQFQNQNKKLSYVLSTSSSKIVSKSPIEQSNDRFHSATESINEPVANNLRSFSIMFSK